MISLLLLVGCGRFLASGEENGATHSWPTQPSALLAACEQEPVPALATLCRLEAARVFGRLADAPGVAAACDPLQRQPWAWECHFIAADAASAANHLDTALGQCALSGHYATQCLRHTGWLLPPLQGTSQQGDARVYARLSHDLRAHVDSAMPTASPELRDNATEQLLAWAGLTLYLGTGSALPAAAHDTGPLGPALRTGFALETARLLRAQSGRPPSVTEILDRWSGRAPPAQGPADPKPVGCYPLTMGEIGAARTTPTWGHALRRVAPTPAADATIAALHAVLWLGEATTQDFIPWFQDASPAVALSAIALARSANDDDDALPEALQRYQALHPGAGHPAALSEPPAPRSPTLQCHARGQTGPPPPP